MKLDLSKILKLIFILILLIVFYNVVYLEIKMENKKLKLEYNQILNEQLSIKKLNKINIKDYKSKKSVINQKDIMKVTKILDEEISDYKIYQNYLGGDKSINLEININAKFLKIIRITNKLETIIGENNIESISINNAYTHKDAVKNSKRNIEKDFFECIIIINSK